MISFYRFVFLMVYFGVALFGCSLSDFGDDMPPYRSYCETHQCLPPTEVRQRPTSFIVELSVNDSVNSRLAKLFTVDCAYLPDEDSTENSVFCVDSIRFGKNDSLRYLPQKNKNTEYAFMPIEVSPFGYALESFVKVPLDDDNHLRFTLVDHENKEKKIDLNLSIFFDMYNVHGDTFDIVFPPNTSFTSYSRGAVAGTGVDDSRGLNSDFGCYDYFRDSTYTIKTRYCLVKEEMDSNGWVRSEYSRDTINCASQRFYQKVEEYKGTSSVFISCNKLVLDTPPEKLTISGLYSLPLMTESIRNLLPVGVHVGNVSGHRYPWHTETHLKNQGPDGDDDFTIYTIYKE